MNEETRQYIEEVVRVLDVRLKCRKIQSAGSYRGSALKNWEKKLYDRAKVLLSTHPREHST